MSSSSVDQIKSKLDIVSLVGSYVKLEKSGASFKGRCPFHNEKTPSFFVSPDRGSYYCFGCGAKGDIFTFVEEFEGLDFKGALKVLADRAGVTLEAFQSGEKSDKDVLFQLTEQATFYFEKNLSENKDALSYLTKRGVTKETIKSFNLGFAKAEWRGLYDFLSSKKASTGDMERAGLIKRATNPTQGEGVYDTFRSRIMFPIADSSGRIVAFSGRIFPDDPNAPKYLNSPETPIFRKSEVLYGLDKAKKDIRLRDYSILVEGQMDLVMLHQAGFTNTVASSGTALTSEHLVRLQRLSNHLLFAYDGDSAGFKAIVRGAEIALLLGMEVKVAVMSDGMDPADQALKDKEGLAKVIKDSKHIISFVLDLAIASSSNDPHVLSQKIFSDVLPFITRVKNESEKAPFIREIASKTGIKENVLLEDLKVVRAKVEKGETEMKKVEKVVTDRSNLILKKLVGIYFWQKESSAPSASHTDLEKEISKTLGTKEFDNLIVLHSPNKDALIFEAEAYYNGRDNLSSDVSILIRNLHEEKLKKEFASAMIELSQAEAAGDTKNSARLLLVCKQLSQKINELKKNNSTEAAITK